MLDEKQLKALKNKIYKLLPEKEEGKDWDKTLDDALTTIAGIISIGTPNPYSEIYIKLSGLKVRGDTIEQKYFRKTVFDCLNLLKR